MSVVSNKVFDAGAAQGQAFRLRRAMRGCQYRHYKGGFYVVVDVAVREADGEILIVYRDEDLGHVWVRTFEDFNESVQGVTRFTRVPS